MKRVTAILLSGLVLLGCARGGAPAPVVYGDAGVADAPKAERAGAPAVPKPPRKPVWIASAGTTRDVAAGTTPRGRAGIHTVERGETVYEISRRYHVPIRAVIAANRLDPPYRLRIGQPLRIPVPRRHVVARGDTLYEISRAYGVDLRELARLNELGPPYTIRPRQVLVVPWSNAGGGETRLAANETSDSSSDASASARRSAAAPQPGSGTSARPASAATATPKAIPQPLPRSSGRFLWPVRGRVLTGFGPQDDGLHNDGINLAADRGTPVRAAENGVVAYVGNELRGFGNLLLIKHADGWITAYAHAQRILVSRGQKVRRGEVVAHVGSSGGVARPQLHFEIRRGSRAVDPLKVLGRQAAALPW